jgi:hypothetical protein
LDTCIVLAEIFGENALRIEKFKKDCDFHNISCFVSHSVEEESYKKITEVTNFLGNTVRETIKYYLEESRKKRNVPLSDPIRTEDLKVLEELFSFYHNTVRKTKTGLPISVSMIEEWVITFLGEKLDSGIKLGISQFQLELIKALMKLTSSIENLYDELVTFQRGFLKISNESPKPADLVVLEMLKIHEPDASHIASAISHQNKMKEKTVFVTFDFSSILNKRHIIKKKLDIMCSSPLYALYHLM